MTPRVREILSWYGADNPGVLTNLARMLNHGKLAGTGKLVILPVDQGFEHGPARSFAKNPDGYDPAYHVELAIESGCSAYAAPLGAIEAIARDYAGEIPLILKINNSDSLYANKAPISAMTSYIDDALRLGCVGIGFTIYPGSAERKNQYEEIAQAARAAKEAGLAVIIWSYPRGEQLSKEGETGIDVIAYAAHIAAQLGAHIIKVKPSSAHLEQAAAKKVYEEQGITKVFLTILENDFFNLSIPAFQPGNGMFNHRYIVGIQLFFMMGFYLVFTVGVQTHMGTPAF